MAACPNAPRSARLAGFSKVAKVTRQPGPGSRNLRAAIAGLDGAQARVGWFESSKYESGVPVALVAVVQENGSATKGIPPRPFMRPTAIEQAGPWREASKAMSQAVIHGQMKPEGVLEGLAQKAEGDIRRTISKVLSPPLKPATIAARARRHSKGKASSKPLVDSGILLNTLTSQVSKK